MAPRILSIGLAAVLLLLISLPFSTCLPFIVIHGLGDECSSETRSVFTERLSNWSGSQGYCMEVGNGIRDSWFIPLEQHAEVICKKVKEMKQLSEGFNLVGVSQGSLIGRAIVQYCDGAPPVKNFVSMGGVHAGTAVLPQCSTSSFCNVVDSLIQSNIYSSYVQDHLAPSNYIKIPTKIPDYLNGNKFLPKLNNELPHVRNATYKERFTSIQKLVLIMFEQDSVLVPKQTSWFGFFADGGYETLVPHQKTKLYIEDWIGLRTLDEAGKVTYVGVPGDHLQIAQDDMKKYIVPYLKDISETETQTSDILALTGEENTLMMEQK